MNKVNKLKYLGKWIDIQTASLKSLWTSEQGEQGEQSEQCEQSEQGEQSEQTQIPD